MGFWTVYFGLVAAMITIEAGHVALSYWLIYYKNKRAADIQKSATEMYKLSKTLGVEPSELTQKVAEMYGAGGSFPTTTFPVSMSLDPTASGEAEEKNVGHGQYL